MDFSVLLIGLGILLVAAIAVGFFFWQNNNKDASQKNSNIEIVQLV